MSMEEWHKFPSMLGHVCLQKLKSLSLTSPFFPSCQQSITIYF